MPRKLLTGSSYPFQWFIGLYPTSHAPLRDARFALLSVLLPLCLLAVLWRVLHKQGDSEKPASQQQVWVYGNHFWLLLLFGLFSYVLWIRTFAIYRYLLPLDLISGLILLLVLDQLITTNRLKLFSFVLLALFRSAGASLLFVNEYPIARKAGLMFSCLPRCLRPIRSLLC